MKVLIVTPVLRDPSGKTRMYRRSLASHFNIEWTGQLDHLLLNGGDNYFNPAQTVTGKYEAGRAALLAGDYTHMLTLEYDMIAPPDTLKRLMEVDADIAYGLYVMRHPNPEGVNRWSAASVLNADTYIGLNEDEDAARRLFGTVFPVVGIGLGCTLIKREVLETLHFRHTRALKTCDWCFALDAAEYGFTQVCNSAVVCGHESLLPAPCVYQVDMNAEHLYRVEFAS